MSGNKVTEYILLHPKGLAIVDLIRRKGRKYITEISNELGINRKVVSYHVRKLEKAGIVTTKLEKTPPELARPVYARYVYLTHDIDTINRIMMASFPLKFKLEPRTILTDEAKTILQTALDRGWFDSPRPDTGKISALAEELGMSEANLSKKLRTISRQLSRGYLETMTRRI